MYIWQLYGGWPFGLHTLLFGTRPYIFPRAPTLGPAQNSAVWQTWGSGEIFEKRKLRFSQVFWSVRTWNICLCHSGLSRYIEWCVQILIWRSLDWDPAHSPASRRGRDKRGFHGRVTNSLYFVIACFKCAHVATCCYILSYAAAFWPQFPVKVD